MIAKSQKPGLIAVLQNSVKVVIYRREAVNKWHVVRTLNYKLFYSVLFKLEKKQVHHIHTTSSDRFYE